MTRYGYQLSADDDVSAAASRAEHLGFDYVCAGEHVVFRRPTLNGLIALSVAAGATHRIRLLSALTVLPLYPAALAAKMIATLDAASGGRLEVGIGVGGDYPNEFEACGVPIRERGARTDEALQVLELLLTKDHVTFNGRYTRLNDVSIEPKPFQKPHPPIWIGGRSPAAVARASRFGAWLPYLSTPEQVAKGLARMRELSEPGAQLRVAVLVGLTVYEDGERARNEAAAFASRSYGKDFAPLVDRFLVAGTPEECRNRLARYYAAGAQTMILQLACDPADRSEMLERLAAEVLDR
jgi:probable F420-dependent oxidoreductase